MLREILSDAIRYWEPRRIVYNLVLSAVVIAWLVLTWPRFRVAFTLQALLLLLMLAAGLPRWLLKFGGGSYDDYAICRSSKVVTRPSC